MDGPELPVDFEIQYVVESSASQSAGAIVLDIYFRSRKKNGEWTTLKDFRISAQQVASLPDPVDVEVLASLMGAQETYMMYAPALGSQRRRALPAALAQRLVPLMAGTGRLLVRGVGAVGICLRRSGMTAPRGSSGWRSGRTTTINGASKAPAARRRAHGIGRAHPDVRRGVPVRARPGSPPGAAGIAPWMSQLREFKRIPFPDRERDTVMERLLASPVLPHLDLDEALRFEERSGSPRVGLRISQKREMWGEVLPVAADL